MDLEGDKLTLRDFPPGPLDRYRKQARFDWKKLKLFVEDADLLEMRMKVWRRLENDPLFQREEKELTTDQQKRLAALRLRRWGEFRFVDHDKTAYRKRTRLLLACNEALAMTFPDVSIKQALGVGLFSNTIITLGTEKHRHFAYAGIEMLSCLALTEIAHGSNTKQLRTTATYDIETKEFVINTPDFEAAKCWVGNLGKQCTFALLFAQLYTKGQCHGLHAFVVPIRDPKTLLPYPGIIVGDMGEKIGLHGIDNGFIIFKQYRVPKDSFLNRTADVTDDGDYESSFTDPGRILGAALENLSMGRVGIIQESSNNLIGAITIAVRYGATRKQFAPDGDRAGNREELPIIEYQLHQWRLFPYMCAAVVLRVFVNSFTETYLNVVEKSASPTMELDNLHDMVSEIHALVSTAKPLLTWTCLGATQECREACGGHGFLRSSRLGDLRNTIDPCVTYEGDNNVLVQQTSNWLVRQWQAVKGGDGLKAPLGSCDFLRDARRISQGRYDGDGDGMSVVKGENFITSCFHWLLVYLLDHTEKKFNRYISNGCDRFTARNHSQVYGAAVLSRAFGEYTALRYFWSRVSTVNNNDPDLRVVLSRLGSLYGLSCLDKHMAYFYQGGFGRDGRFSEDVKRGVLELCEELKPDSLSVIDAIAPTDYVLNSVLGKSDGKLYENLQTVIMHSPGALSRPDWWKDITCDYPRLSSKL